MNEHACFRVAIDDVAADFRRFAELARSRTFEIFDDGKSEVLLVRKDVVNQWYSTLQVSVPAELMTDEEIASMQRSRDKLRNRRD